MPYIFIDESGQFAKHKDDEYFVVASFTIGNPKRIRKEFKKWHREKFPRKMRYQQEIKFSDVKITDSLRLRTLKQISKLDVRINYVYLKRKNIPEEYWSKSKFKSGHLYTNIIGEVLEQYFPITDKEFRVFCDERHLKGIKRSQFKEMLKTRMAPQLSTDSLIQIEMVDSKNDYNIQIADWIAGALFSFLENKENGQDFYDILKGNIINGRELFKDHWEEKFKNKKLNP